MSSFLDVCRFTAASSGTGDFVVASAVTGYQTPASAGAFNARVYSYRAENAALTEWEVGYGAYTVGSTTLARTVVLSNSSGTTSKTSFTAAPQVAVVALTQDLAWPSPPQGRLTLQTGVPVMSTTQTGKTTIYYTPYNGNQIPIYDGTSMTMRAFSELSVLTTDTAKSPAAIGASKANDWFIWDDAGTLRIGHGPDWTNDTTRSAGTALVMVNGILLNNASITNGPAASRGTYVGTTYSNSSSQLVWRYGSLAAAGSSGFFGVWNAYNRRPVSTLVADSTDTWTYNVANTWRAPNGSTEMRVSAVRGLDEDGITATYAAIAVAGAGTNAYAGIGLNVTTAYSGTTGFNGNTFSTPIAAFYAGLMGLGFNYVSAIEANSSTTTSTWLGDSGAPLFIQTGLAVTLHQ